MEQRGTGRIKRYPIPIGSPRRNQYLTKKKKGISKDPKKGINFRISFLAHDRTYMCI